MLVERVLDLARVDAVAAAQDHVLDAVDEVQIAVGVEVADVAGAEPAVGERLARRLGVAPVAAHHPGRDQLHLAGLARRHRLPVAVRDAHGDARAGRADRARLVDVAREM